MVARPNRWVGRVAVGAVGFLTAVAAGGLAAAQDIAEGALQRGDFDAVLAAATEEDDTEARFYVGLAHLALGNYDEASVLLREVAVQAGDNNPEWALQATVAVVLALSRNGKREAACEYVTAVQPLVTDLSLLWQGWIEQVRRQNRCG